jgi:hypothetical protein
MRARWIALGLTLATLLWVGGGPSAQVPKPLPTKPLGPEARLKSAERALGRIRAILNRVLKLQESARKEKDILKLNCINEKLIAVKGLLRVAEQAFASLQEAVQAQGDLAQHETERIDTAAQRAREVGNEAEACTGEASVYTGPILLELEIDPAIPPHDPTLRPDPGVLLDRFPWLDRPQALSPSM